MSPRKDRPPVVLDTNVVIGYYLSTNSQSANAKVYLLWRTRRRLQLVVSGETVTHVNLGARPTEGRDPDDNLMLATAAAGKAAYLVTNDRDLLDIPDTGRRMFKFAILTPAQFLAELEEAAKA